MLRVLSANAAQAQKDAVIVGVDAAAQTAVEDKQKDYDKLNLQVLGCIRLYLAVLI